MSLAPQSYLRVIVLYLACLRDKTEVYMTGLNEQLDYKPYLKYFEFNYLINTYAFHLNMKKSAFPWGKLGVNEALFYNILKTPRGQIVTYYKKSCKKNTAPHSLLMT